MFFVLEFGFTGRYLRAIKPTVDTDGPMLCSGKPELVATTSVDQALLFNAEIVDGVLKSDPEIPKGEDWEPHAVSVFLK